VPARGAVKVRECKKGVYPRSLFVHAHFSFPDLFSYIHASFGTHMSLFST